MDGSLKDKICAAIDKEDKSLRELSLDIWNHPELCFEEHHAHDVLTQYLAKQGFQVTKNYKLETAFQAYFSNPEGKKDEPYIAVMCEYDALPGIGHACGHNLIAIFGVAVALGIKQAMQAAGIKGRLAVLGTPAEEGGGGKIDLINAGAFQEFDVAMMAHPSQRSLPKPIYVAMTGVDVEFEGKASHAASAPWCGVNALDAAVLCYQNVSCMRQHMKPSWRAHGIITHGGDKANIIPQHAALQFYARAPTNTELSELTNKLVSCFEGAATATGCSVKYTFFSKPYDALNTNAVMAELYEKHGEELGLVFEKDAVQLMKQGGSTDMGNVSQILPSIHPKYGIDPTAAGHTVQFREVSGTEKSHAITLTHAKAMALMAVDVMMDPKLMDTVKAHFNHK